MTATRATSTPRETFTSRRPVVVAFCGSTARAIGERRAGLTTLGATFVAVFAVDVFAVDVLVVDVLVDVERRSAAVRVVTRRAGRAVTRVERDVARDAARAIRPPPPREDVPTHCEDCRLARCRSDEPTLARASPSASLRSRTADQLGTNSLRSRENGIALSRCGLRPSDTTTRPLDRPNTAARRLDRALRAGRRVRD